jgi:hypothetical protein
MRRGFDGKNSNMGMCVCYHAMQHLQASLWSHPTNWHEKSRDALVRRISAHDERSLFVTNDGQQFLGEQG